MVQKNSEAASDTVAFQIREMPRKIRDELQDRADEAGQSSSAFVLKLVKDELGQISREQWVARLRSKPRNKLPKPAVEMLHEARRDAGRE